MATPGANLVEKLIHRNKKVPISNLTARGTCNWEQEFGIVWNLLSNSQRAVKVIWFQNELLWESNWLENTSHLMKFFISWVLQHNQGCFFKPYVCWLLTQIYFNHRCSSFLLVRQTFLASLTYPTWFQSNYLRGDFFPNRRFS